MDAFEETRPMQLSDKLQLCFAASLLDQQKIFHLCILNLYAELEILATFVCILLCCLASCHFLAAKSALSNTPSHDQLLDSLPFCLQL